MQFCLEVKLLAPFDTLKDYSVTSWLDVTKKVKVSYYWNYESDKGQLDLTNLNNGCVKVKHFECGNEYQFSSLG